MVYQNKDLSYLCDSKKKRLIAQKKRVISRPTKISSVVQSLYKTNGNKRNPNE